MLILYLHDRLMLNKYHVVTFRVGFTGGDAAGAHAAFGEGKLSKYLSCKGSELKFTCAFKVFISDKALGVFLLISPSLIRRFLFVLAPRKTSLRAICDEQMFVSSHIHKEFLQV